MNREQRVKGIAAWLNWKTGLMANFKAPDLPNLEGELMMIVGAVEEILPNLPPDEIRALLQRAAQLVRRRAAHRGWPVCSEITNAVRDAAEQHRAEMVREQGDSYRLKARVGAALDWLERRDTLPSFWTGRELCLAMVEAGGDYEKIRAAGGDLPTRDRVSRDRIDAVLVDLRERCAKADAGE